MRYTCNGVACEGGVEVIVVPSTKQLALYTDTRAYDWRGLVFKPGLRAVHLVLHVRGRCVEVIVNLL